MLRLRRTLGPIRRAVIKEEQEARGSSHVPSVISSPKWKKRSSDTTGEECGLSLHQRIEGLMVHRGLLL